MTSVPEHKPQPRFRSSVWEAIRGTGQYFAGVRIVWRHLILDRTVLLRVSVEGALKLLIATAGWFGFARIVAVPVLGRGK